MDRPQWTDRLTDAFLLEALADQRPPDLTAQILVRAAAQQRRRRRWVPLAAAAALALTAALWMAWPAGRSPVPPPAYPSPVAAGDYLLEGSGPIRRGSTVHTDRGEAELLLGGYARVALQPGSSVVIGGRPNAEGLVLARGEVECDVQAGKARLFTVQTEWGTVSVVGTRFTVQLNEEENDEMNARSMTVKVIVGTVMVTSLGAAPSVLHAGERGNWGRRPTRAGAGRSAVREAKTPLEKARAACLLQEQALRKQRQQIEDQVLQLPAVAAALTAAHTAARAYHKQLNDHPEYADLKRDRATVATEFRTLMGTLRRGRREDWQKHRDQFTKLRTRSAELRGKMLKLGDSVPELAALKKKKMDALVAFLTLYQESLKADKAYAESATLLAEITEWTREVEDQMAEERSKARAARQK